MQLHFAIDKPFQLNKMARPRRDGNDPTARLHYALQLLWITRRIDPNDSVHAGVSKRQTLAGGDAKIHLRIALRTLANSGFRHIQPPGSLRLSGKGVGVVPFPTANIQQLFWLNSA